MKEGTTTIRMTTEDIEFGIPAAPDQCPVAIALYRETEQCYRVGEVKAVAFTHEVEISDELSDWIAAFDNGDAVLPITLELSPELLTIRGKDSE